MTSTSSPFDARTEAFIDSAWEVYHEYPGYKADDRILQASGSILQVIESDNDGIDDATWRIGNEALSLLDSRYAEITSGEELGAKISQPEPILPGRYVDSREKLERVFKEWSKRYFMPRVDEATTDDYNQWLLSRIQYRGMSSVSLYTQQPDINQKFYMALAPIRLVPMWVGGQFNESESIIAPPDVSIEMSSNGSVYFWKDLSASRNSNHFPVFPSTLELLRSLNLL